MPPYGLISLVDRPFFEYDPSIGTTDITRGVNIPEELAARGYGDLTSYDYDPAFGTLRTTERYQPAPFTGARPFQALYDISPRTISGGVDFGFDANLFNPSFGGVSGYRDTGGIMGIDVAPSVPVQDFEFLKSAYEDDDEEQVEYLPGQEPQGIAKLFKTIGDIYGKLPTPMNLMRGFAERVGEPSRYSRFGPEGTFRGGIYNIDGVNTPIQLVNDFYDRTTGLNRFDRAGQRFARTGKTSDLFASSRTLADFVRNKREIDAAKRAASASVSSTPTGGGEGRGSYTPSISRSQAAANRDAARGRR